MTAFSQKQEVSAKNIVQKRFSLKTNQISSLDLKGIVIRIQIQIPNIFEKISNRIIFPSLVSWPCTLFGSVARIQ